LIFESLLRDVQSIFRPGRDAADALPVMDGPWTPNRLLDTAAPLGEAIADCDDLIVTADGTIFVSAGHTVWRMDGPDLARRAQHAHFDGSAGALAEHAGYLYVAVAGGGVRRLDPEGREIARLDTAGGEPLRCVTALAVLPDGRVAVAEGSAHNPPERWCHDLMEKRIAGRILLAAADLSSVEVLASGLAWPAGLLVRNEGRRLWFSESWTHSVHSLDIENGRIEPVLNKLPGYAGRLNDDGEGGAWLALFAVRTHLIELVLRERKFREEMLATVDPRYWIAPSLQSTGHYLEPLQGGALKKLGVTKPWAPPLSYGLVARISAYGECRRSWHSRAGGLHHGITSACSVGDRLIAVSKGSGQLLDVPLLEEQRRPS